MPQGMYQDLQKKLQPFKFYTEGCYLRYNF